MVWRPKTKKRKNFPHQVSTSSLIYYLWEVYDNPQIAIPNRGIINFFNNSQELKYSKVLLCVFLALMDLTLIWPSVERNNDHRGLWWRLKAIIHVHPVYRRSWSFASLYKTRPTLIISTCFKYNYKSKAKTNINISLVDKALISEKVQETSISSSSFAKNINSRWRINIEWCVVFGDGGRGGMKMSSLNPYKRTLLHCRA